MSSSDVDDWDLAEYPPETFLEPWTLRRLRRFASGQDNLRPLLDRLRERRRVDVALDPTIATYLDDRATDWAQDSDCDRDLAEAALHVGYLWGRLLFATADQAQQWSDEPDHGEIGARLDRTVAEIDWSGCAELPALDAAGVDAIVMVLHDVLATHGQRPGGELEDRVRMMCEEGWCLALVERSTTRPPADHVMVDLTQIRDLLPADVLGRVWIAEALGCLLARLDERGRCSEADLRDAADELGGERGHRYFRQFRRWGLVDYTLTRHHTGTVLVRRHRELRSGPPGS